MILPDYPIEKQDQDQLKRSPLAIKVANMISGFNGKESFVIGVEGKWGSGKTSFINLVLAQLDSSTIVYIKFNPWNFSDEASLLRDFFIKFSEAVEKVTGKNTGKKMKEYAGKLSDVDLGISYQGFSINPLKLLKVWSPDTSLDAIRKELDIALSGIEKKIVVVIDDIDRLDKKETKLILKLVKLTADFPKTIFVLAYDRNRVEDRITEKENGLDGGEYLKKIIQVSFSLPVPDQQELWNLLFKDLDASIEAVYGTTDFSNKEDTRWSELFNSGFNNVFVTIRDIKRYVSSLRLDWSIMGKSDVNKIDFLGIEAVRVFAPRFYDAIPVNRGLFVQSLEHFGSFNQNESEVKRKMYQELLDTLIPDEAVRKSIDGICKELFPQLNSTGSSYSEEWEQDLRICSRERFNFYFQLGIPFGEISENQIDELVASIATPNDFKALILQFKEEKRLRKVLSRLLQRRGALDEAQIKIIISTLWELEKEIDDGRDAVFDLDDIDTQVLRIGYHFIKQLPQEKRKLLLVDIIQTSTNVYFPIHLIAVIKDDYVKETARAGVSLISETELKELEQLLVEKIKAMVTSGTLINEKHLVTILYRWREWESPDAVTSYIHNVISTRDGFLIFLQSFVGKVLSSAGNYNDLNKDSITGLYPIEEIESLVSAVTDDELSNMTPQGKEAIDLFRNPHKRW
jgi:predicted KAP-like P-loop ATPase